MAQAYTSFTRANCDWPGMNLEWFYNNHSSMTAHAACWLPSNNFQGAPLLIVVNDEGYGHDPGWGKMTRLFTGKFLALATALSAAGWVIISIDNPATGKNIHSGYGASSTQFGDARVIGTWAEVTPIVPWPEQAVYIAKAVQHFKTHYSAIPGPTEQPLGRQYWGKGNSIDPSKVVLYGNKHGGTLAMFAALQPSTFYNFDSDIGHDTVDVFVPRASHQVAAVIASSPMTDHKLFHIDAGFTSPAPTIFHRDAWGAYSRAEDARRWSQIPSQVKGASPIHSLRKYYAEQGSLGFYVEWLGSGFNDPLWDANTSYADLTEGITMNNTAAGKALIDPTDGRVWGPQWDAAIGDWGTGIAGASGTKIRTSITRYGSSVVTDSTAFVTEVRGALQMWGLP